MIVYMDRRQTVMSTNLYREFYKFSHKKATWFAPLIVLFLMVAFGLATGKDQPQLLAMTCYGSSEGILLTLIIVISSIFSMEFQNHAILTVLYKSPSKRYVYLAKLIVASGYNLILHLSAILLTFALTLTGIAKPISWLSVYQYHQPLIINMLATSSIDFVTATLLISIIFLTSCLINSNAVVVTLNIVIIFVGNDISYNFLLQNAHLVDLARWNPFNMLDLTKQYYNHAMIQATNLTISQLIIGTSAYVMVFLMAGYLVFRKKRF